MPPLPANPQPLAELRQRYQKALEYTYDVVSIIENDAIRPGECAANVFDFEDGSRLIVSREKLLDGKVYIHFSASVLKYCRMTMRMRREKTSFPEYLLMVQDIFRELSRETRKINYIGMVNYIPHWMIEEK